jgi:toll-interacting protein
MIYSFPGRYETQTDPNGGKTPRWNRVFHTQLPSGVNKIFIEIYDECNFTMDELIAWTEVSIPEVVIERGETHEDWWVCGTTAVFAGIKVRVGFRYPLSGKTGDLKEGMIDLVLSFTTASNIAARPLQNQQPVVFVPNVSGRALPVYIQPQPQMPQQQIIQQQPPPPAQPLTEEDISNLMEMFPSVDKDVIKSIGKANRGNKEATINSLLQLTN